MANSFYLNYQYNGFWKQFFRILLVLIFIWLLYYFFLSYQTRDWGSSRLGFNMPNKARTLDKLETQLEDEKKQLQDIRKTDDVIRFDISRYINNKEDIANRSDNINNLIRMYTELQTISRNTANGIILSDFTIQDGQIQVKGKVLELRFMYIKNGIIDRFSALDFVDNITIPYYQKNSEYYDFILKGDLVKPKEAINTSTWAIGISTGVVVEVGGGS